MERYHYGIDFGTTNSAISIYDRYKNEIVDTISLPSILYFPKEQKRKNNKNFFVGNEATLEYVNDGMNGRFMKAIKRVLPRSSFTETLIYGKKYTSSDLVSLIVKELKERADKKIGEECTSAIIGRPVFFDDDDITKDELAETRLSKAMILAGFTNFKFQYEPIAAAFAYEKTINKNEKVLVADFGGGTTDFTYIELSPNNNNENRKKDILATGGIYVGGDSFDSAFMMNELAPFFGRDLKYESMPGKMLDIPSKYFFNISNWEKMNFYNSYKIIEELNRYYVFTGKDSKLKNLITLVEKNLGYQIFKSIEQTKIDLSKRNDTDFYFKNYDIFIEEPISIEKYNEIISNNILKIENYLDEFLKLNNINLNEINTIFLTGGSSLVKAVHNIFTKRFDSELIKTGDNFLSVSKGLAYSGYLLS